MTTKSVNTLTAILLTAGLAHADGGDWALPMVNLPDDFAVAGAGREPTCGEILQASRFAADMARSDGNVAPATAGAACGAEGAGSGYRIVPVAYRPGETEEAEGQSCAQKRQHLWFLAELSRTDGNTDPEVPHVACNADREIYAEFGLDAD